MNVSQFVLEAPLDAADDILADQARIVFSPDAFDEFCWLLDEPHAVLKNLQVQLAKGSIFK
jgi:uncharacterized protein (DUF1778 family)